MTAEDTALTEEIQRLQDRSKKFDDWIDRFNGERAGTESPIPSETRTSLARIQEELESLKAAVLSPPACALYGPSQAGKSLLISAMVEHEQGGDGALGHPSDSKAKKIVFSKDLNAVKGREATAVVTRFSSYERLGYGELDLFNAPVMAKLFSLADLMKAMGLGFAGECEYSTELNAESIRKAIDDGSMAMPMDDEAKRLRLAICDAFDYLASNYESASRYNQLSTNEFTEILNENDLGLTALKSIAKHVFWDDWESINARFDELYDLLKKISSDANQIWLSWEATHFILDSQRSEKYERSLEDERSEPPFEDKISWDELRLTNLNDRFEVFETIGSELDYANLQALVCELTIPIDFNVLPDFIRSLMEKGDILDIPGEFPSGGANKFTEDTYGDSPDFDQNHIIKRGKVNFFFGEYAKALQSTSLVYLERFDGNLNLHNKIVPNIALWGKRLYGDEWPRKLPEEMEGSEHSLSLCLTNIDKGVANMPLNFDLPEAALGRFHQHNYEWFNNYGNTEEPFNNVYLLRYPGKLDDRESQIAPEWKGIFSDTDMVKDHIKDFDQKWDACFSDDGGVHNLARNVEKALDNGPKRKQISEKCFLQGEKLQRLMNNLYVDPNPQAEMDKRKNKANEVLNWLSDDTNGMRSVILSAKLTVKCSSTAMRVESDLENYATMMLDKWFNQKWTISESDTPIDLAEFASFLREYLVVRCMGEITKILKLVAKSVNPNSPPHAYHRYVETVFNDFLLEPGPRREEYPDSFDSTGVKHASKVLISRWNEILGDRLASAVGEARTLPAGNEELEELR